MSFLKTGVFQKPLKKADDTELVMGEYGIIRQERQNKKDNRAVEFAKTAAAHAGDNINKDIIKYYRKGGNE